MKSITFIRIMILVQLALIASVNSQNAVSGSKYVPKGGKVIHGLGQYVSHIYSDSANWQYVSEYQNGVDQIPVIYSVYAGIDSVIRSLDKTDFIDITQNHGYPYYLLIGLDIHDSLAINYNFNVPVEDILNGKYDSGILDVARRIKELNAPVFFRPGFEFGSGNSGYHTDPDLGAEDFKKIWSHIYNIFEEEKVPNVSWVWSTVNPNAFDYMNWYPGDKYVDWWGINYFTVGQIDNGDAFLYNARLHNKPVMICESCPIQNGGTTVATNWENWFVPFFSKMVADTNIKAFVYISDPWEDGPTAFWPDSRINSNQVILDNYAAELTNSRYIHMAEYLDNIPREQNVSYPVDYLISFQNYPNPFNAATVFDIKLSSASSFKIDIYSITGEIVASLSSHKINHDVQVRWETEHIPTGIYFAKLTVINSNNLKNIIKVLKLVTIK